MELARLATAAILADSKLATSNNGNTHSVKMRRGNEAGVKLKSLRSSSVLRPGWGKLEQQLGLNLPFCAHKQIKEKSNSLNVQTGEHLVVNWAYPPPHSTCYGICSVLTGLLSKNGDSVCCDHRPYKKKRLRHITRILCIYRGRGGAMATVYQVGRAPPRRCSRHELTSLPLLLNSKQFY